MSQSALFVNKIAEPLSLGERPIPQPSENQVLAKVTIAGLNPHDQKSRDTGLFISEHLPAVLSNDVVGIITELGPGVKKFNVGDHVVSHPAFTHGSLQNGLQHYAVFDVPFTAKIPNGISGDEAATLPTNVIASLVGLFHSTGLNIPAPWTDEAKSFDYAGTTILIVGGGSNCGKFAVQLAKLAGIGRIIVVGSKKSEDDLRLYGATDVIDRHRPDVLQQIKALVGEDLVYAFDAVNGPEGQLLALDALSNEKRGTFARLVPRPIDESKIRGKKAGFEIKSILGSSQLKADVSGPFWERLPGYLEKGDIKPLSFQVVEGLNAGKVNELLDRYRDGKDIGLQVHVHVSA